MKAAQAQKPARELSDEELERQIEILERRKDKILSMSGTPMSGKQSSGRLQASKSQRLYDQVKAN